MKLRRSVLSHETTYILDGAIDQWEINPFDYAALTLFGQPEIIDRIIETPRPMPRGWLHSRGQMCLDLDAYAHELAAELPPQEQRALFAGALLGEGKKLKELSEILAGWNFEDETTGGCLKEWRRTPRVTRNGDPMRRLKRSLESASAIRRYVAHADESVPHARTLAAGLRRLPWPDRPEEADTLIPYFDEQRKAYEAAKQRAIAAMTTPDGAASQAIPTKPQRKMLRHAAAVAASLLGTSQVSAFAHGQTVEIPGSSIIFAATAQGPLTQLGHGGMRIQLRDRAGANLAGLCLYFEDQPTLDQLASLALHIQSGDETELISTGNLYAVTSDGARHPAIADRVKSRPEIVEMRDFPEILEIADPSPLSPRFRRDLQVAAQARYMGVAADHYLAATEVAVWGTDVKKLRRFNEAVRHDG